MYAWGIDCILEAYQGGLDANLALQLVEQADAPPSPPAMTYQETYDKAYKETYDKAYKQHYDDREIAASPHEVVD